jgi:hypothetical protein
LPIVHRGAHIYHSSPGCQCAGQVRAVGLRRIEGRAWGKQADSFCRSGLFLRSSTALFRTIGFVGLAGNSTSGEPKQTGSAKLKRFVSENWLFFLEFRSSFSYVRRLSPQDSIVKVRTIRFVGLAFIIASREGWRTDAWKQFLKGSRQQFSGICDRPGPTSNLQNTILRVTWRLL